MNFYAMRCLFADGDWSHPWTAWADDMAGAIAKAEELSDAMDAVEFTIRLRPPYEAESFWGHEMGEAIVEHPDVHWHREYPTGPISPHPVKE